ncbi:molybdopterin-binding protein [Asticcacaulis sp. YBE204]|uniref:competence/damage-inducible protein A n=1 Tax=Asticcacaulis sp. YBE204 TaxID=1282363 RepID=UPI0003C3D99B|nr:molybdopterin-binding protein [Asticcacaulis sp. YBE204]ESQ77333.1 molybdenum cofactor biosynthesis protein [Asticcacaulis sp. YBE204]
MTVKTEDENPTAAVLIIGDEILSGRTQDTNVNTIAKFLGALGIDLVEVRMVHDVEAQIVRTLNELRTSVDYVFTTGGIGPTHDDITADCVAKAFGVGIDERQDALDILLARYGGDANLLNPNSRRMARIPDGASLIVNPVSGAPGFQLENVFVMAGVPRIMAGMLNDLPHRLRHGQQVQSRTVKATYVPESLAADILKSLDAQYPDLSLGSYPFGIYPEEFGTQLVIRGRNADDLDAAFAALLEGLPAVVEQARQRYPAARLDVL